MLKKLKNKGFAFFPLNDWIISLDKKFTYNYFTILWSGPSELEGSINDEDFLLEPNTLLYLSPNKSLDFKSASSEGVVLLFTSEFFERSNVEGALLYNDIFFNEVEDFHVSTSSLSVEDFLNYYVNRLNYTYSFNESLFLSIAHNITESLILEALSKSNRQLIIKETADEDQIISNKFLNLLQIHYKNEKKVSFYADELNITPRSLNKALTQSTQKTAKQLIIEKIIRESKKLLKFSNLPIYNIAWELGFSDEGNFSAFFKKHTELSPYEFKNKKDLLNCH